MRPEKRRAFLRRVILIAVAVILALAPITAARAAAPDPDDFALKSCAVADAETGFLIFSKNYSEQIYPASTTKVMTALLTLENCVLSDTMTVGEEVAGVGEKESQMYLEKGEVLTVEQLLYGLMLVSANDAARTLAVNIGGSIEEFADMMNKRCTALGMKNTHFTTPHGLQSEEHYTTAEDMMKLTLEAVKNEQFMKIVGTHDYDIAKTDSNAAHYLRNTNRLICTGVSEQSQEKDDKYIYEYATGIKTGSTTAAANCLIASAKKDGRSLVAVFFGDESDGGANRWTYARQLFDYGFTAYKDVKIEDVLKEQSLTVNVEGHAPSDSGELVCRPDCTEAGVITLPSETKLTDLKIESSYLPDESIAAPVKKGDAVGTAQFTLDGEVIFDGKLVAERDVSDKDPEPSATIPSLTLVPNGESGGLQWWWIAVPAVVVLGLLAALLIRNAVLRKRRRRRRRSHGRQ